MAIIAFGLLIIIHELGHFALAKINGVKVQEFSIGMGPKLFGIKGKETEYMIKLFPIGGYVKMFGEEETTGDTRGFQDKSPIRRITIIAAGAIMNYVLAIILFSFIGYRSGFATTTIKDFAENSPAYNVGIREGDRLLEVDNKRIFTKDDLIYQLYTSKGTPINLKVKSGNEVKSFNVTPLKAEDGRYIIGVTFEFIEKPSIIQAIGNSFKQTISLVGETFDSLKILISGKANYKTDVGGPVTIVKMTGTAAKAGIEPLIWFTAFLSVQLAVFNLLPFPALDGGWIVILLIELISRRKVPDKVIATINTVGFMLLIGLMILVTAKDIIFPVKL